MRRKVAVILALSMMISGPAAPQLTARAAEDITIEEAFEESDEEESLSFEEDDFSDDEEEFLSFDEDVTLDFEEDEESLQEAPEPVADKEASTGIVIEDGMAQPTVKYSEIKPGYTNEGSDILRFAVYIETDYDTDEDGKKDLVQAVIQVPKAAAEQKYDAPTIFEASPYFAGTDDTTGLNEDDPEGRLIKSASEEEVGDWTESVLYDPTSGERRPYDAEKAITSSELAARDKEPAFSSENWFYKYENVKKSDTYYYYALNDHDYYLIRGFAVVESAGLGTNGSDGLETCGSIAEVSAFKNVVEWINHKEGRHAFADKAGTIPIEADWSNGKVAMRGCSYNGTMAYEVAATGVEGLETVVPEAAIASWYEYSNTQGVSHYLDNKYTSFLAGGNSSRLFGRDPLETEDPDAWAALRSLLSKLYGYFDICQQKLAGHFGPYWEAREYSYVDNIKIPALIVTGLNDYNVNPKQADLMRQAFERSGQDVRIILHQGTHETLESIMIDGMYYLEILNKWYCHYLLDVDNGMPNELPPVYVQSNATGDFTKFDKWYGDETLSYSFSNTEEVTLLHPQKDGSEAQEEQEEAPKPAYGEITGDFMMSGDDPYFTMEDYIDKLNLGDAPAADAQGGRYWESLAKRVPDEVTIQGTASVTVRAKVPELPEDGKRMVLGAFLYDISETDFPAYKIENASLGRSVYLSKGIYLGEGLENLDIETFKQTPVKQKLITKGVIDLGSPGAGYDPRSAVSENISADTYYDYTIHMIPTVYTIQPGHYLWLYLVPGMDGVNSDVDIVLNNHAGQISIPVGNIPKGFENDDFTEECVDEDGNKKIIEKVNGQVVSVKIVDTSDEITTVSSNIWIKNLSPEYVYLGVPVTPFIEVYDGTKLLTAGKDYTISYSNNTKPTQASGKDSKLTVTFKGDYSKTQTINHTYKISKAVLSDNADESDVIASEVTAAYTGKAINPVPVLKYNCDNGKEIKKASFKFSYLKEGASEPISTIKEAGQYTIIIEPQNEKSYFTGKMTAPLTVIDNKNKLLQNAKVTFTPATYTFTGKAIVPATGAYSLTLKLDGKTTTTLTEKTDYEVSSVRNNIDPGKAEVIFTAVEGNEKGLSGSVKGTFTIKKGKDISTLADNEIYYENYVKYAKSGATPSWVVLYDDGVLLEAGKDYTISYKDNKVLTASNSGKKAKLIIKGKGRYKGSLTRDFNVVQCSIGDMTISTKDKVIPTKAPKKGKKYENPVITITDPQGKTLKAGTDYTIDYYMTKNESGEYIAEIDDSQACQIYVSVSGLGNYFGSAEASYMYYDKKNDLSKATVRKNISPKTFSGAPAEVTYEDLTELLATGTKKNPGTYLVYGTDFYLEAYRNNEKAGTASVVLRGTGIYGGTKTIKFTVKPQEPKKYLGVLK